jgi:hypothetical protein
MEVDEKVIFSPLGPECTEYYHFVILRSEIDHRKYYLVFGLKFVENEFKGASVSIHLMMKSNPQKQSNDVMCRITAQTLGSCKIAFVVSHVHSQTEMFIYQISV